MPDTDIIFKAGYQYVYTISVIYSGLDVDATIDDWEVDPDNPGDEGQAVYLPYTYDAGTNTYRVYTAEGVAEVARCGVGRSVDKLYSGGRYSA